MQRICCGIENLYIHKITAQARKSVCKYRQIYSGKDEIFSKYMEIISIFFLWIYFSEIFSEIEKKKKKMRISQKKASREIERFSEF
jgi:hypothetical protein